MPTTSLFKGYVVLTKAQYCALASRDANKQYFITDLPSGSISNADMALALTTESVLYKDGDVFTCIDDGDYVKGLQYVFTNDNGNYSWELVSILPDDEMSDESENSVQNRVIKEYVDEGLATKQDRNLIFTNVEVDTWEADNTYAEYPYRAYVELEGVDPMMFPYVVFDMNDAASGNYGPAPESTIGGVYIWAKVNTTIIIPVIILSKSISLDVDYEENAAGGYTLTITDADTHLEENPAGGYTLVVEE